MQLLHRNRLIELKTILGIYQNLAAASLTNLNLIAGSIE
jgi:hypothetical protein